MTRMIAALVSLLLVSGCAGASSSLPSSVTAIPTSAGACEAMRPSFPMKEVGYHRTADTRETVGEVREANYKTREANARFAVACP